MEPQKRNLMKYIILAVLVLNVACSSYKKDKKEIMQEKSETTVTDSKSLGMSINELITNSQTLNEQQKTQLIEILAENKKTAESLSEESYKSRGVLVKELLTGKSTKRRIRILQKDIKRIEDLRLKNTFDTVKKISSIVSKNPEHHEDITRHLMNERGAIGR